MAHIIRQGDLLPSLELVLRDKNGPVDLTNTTVRLHLASVATGAVVLDRAARFPPDQSGVDRGRVFYDWQASDTAVAGEYDAEVEVTFLSGKTRTFPSEGLVRVRVTPQLA